MSGGYNAGGLVAYPLPDEVVVPLRREELDTLCEGSVGELRASRDLCIGAAVGALIGLAGILATTDWETVWKPERRLWFLIPFLIASLIAVGTFVGALIYGSQNRRTAENSSFSRLKARLLKLFEEPRSGPLQGGPAYMPQEPRGISWQNVASLFWLGSDLGWTIQMIRRQMPKDKIVHGLRQSHHHAAELGLLETEPGKNLSSLKVQVESLAETSLTQQLRDQLVAKIEKVNQGVGDLARIQQPDFLPGPS